MLKEVSVQQLFYSNWIQLYKELRHLYLTKSQVIIQAHKQEVSSRHIPWHAIKS